MCAMVCRLNAVHALRRSHHVRWSDLLTCHHQCHCQIGNASNILNETLTVLENVFRVSGIGKIMSKRSAVEKLDLISVMKKSCPQIAVDVKESFGSNKHSADNKTSECNTSSISSASPAVHDTITSMSSSENLEDSGIVVTPVVDRLLARIPNMPGFLLNPPKSFPGPKFDFASSDTGGFLPSSETSSPERNASMKDISTEMNSVSGSPQSELDKNNCRNDDDHTSSNMPPVTSHVCKNTSQLVCVRKPSSDRSNDESDTSAISMAAGNDTKSEFEVDASIFKTADLVKSKVSNASAEGRSTHTDKEERKILSSSTENGSDQRGKHKQHLKQQTVKQAPPPLKPLKDEGKQPVTKREHKKRETQTSKGRQQSTLTSKGKETEVTSAMQKQLHQTKPCSSHSQSGTRKRESDDQAKLLDSASVTDKTLVQKAQAEHHGTSDLSPNKKKKTVLPASLLKEVVKTVQENVETISRQVVATPFSESSAPTNAGSAASNRKEGEDSLAADTRCAVDKTNNSVTEGDVESSDLPTDHVLQQAALETGSQSNGGRKVNPDSESALQTADQDAAFTGETKMQPVGESALPTEKQGTNKVKTSQENEGTSSSSRPTEQSLCQSSDATTDKVAADDGNDIMCADHSQLANSHESENNLLSVLPVECVETEKSSSGQIQKAKKKAKKKKKSKHQRKSTGGDSENLLGILPDYIPESDSRLNKKKEDKVYNLSALFSGQLLNSQPSPKRSRPNYFFAIQITNPEIKAGFSAVQQGVEEACPKMKPAFVAVESAHLTLGVMHLPDEEAITRVISAMEEFRVIHEEQRLQERQGLSEQEQKQTAEKRTASVDLPNSSTRDSSENPASVHVKIVTTEPSTVSTCDSTKTVTVDPSVTATTDLMKTDTSDPLNTAAADHVSTGTVDAVKNAAADSVKIYMANPVNTNTATPVNTDTVDPVKMDTDTADPVNASTTFAVNANSPALVNTNLADPVKTNAADLENTDVKDPVKINTTDLENPDTVDPVNTDSAGPTRTGSAGVEKCDPADGEKVCSAPVLEVKGLDTFRNDVVFAKVTEGAALDQVKAMAELLRSQVLDQDINMDSKPFAPHITLMKTSKSPGKLKASGIKKIDSKLYQEFSDMHFGNNVVNSVQLCSMLKPKQNKYYHIEYEVPVSLD